jgi:hypothetical protein
MEHPFKEGRDNDPPDNAGGRPKKKRKHEDEKARPAKRSVGAPSRNVVVHGTDGNGNRANRLARRSHSPSATRVRRCAMPKRPSRKKDAAAGKAASPADLQARADRLTAERLRERTVRATIGKFQGRKSI